MNIKCVCGYEYQEDDDEVITICPMCKAWDGLSQREIGVLLAKPVDKRPKRKPRRVSVEKFLKKKKSKVVV